MARLVAPMVIEFPEADSILGEDVTGVKVDVDPITVQRPQEHGLYRRTMWYSWTSRVPVNVTRCVTVSVSSAARLCW